MVMQQRRRAVSALEVDAAKAYHLYFKVGLSYREVAQALNVPFDAVKRAFKFNGWKFRPRAEATKLRWEKAHNCRVVAVVPLRGTYDIYDIEVPETHCFSANGVIVGNSVHPELPHGLEYIVSVYGQTPAWKDMMRGAKTHMIDQPDDKTRTYNARVSSAMRPKPTSPGA